MNDTKGDNMNDYTDWDGNFEDEFAEIVDLYTDAWDRYRDRCGDLADNYREMAEVG